MFFVKKAGFFSKSRSAKIEQLLSFILSVLVSIAGFVFLYSSLERLMYPTPVWFQLSFLYIVIATAFIKLIMFFFLRYQYKKLGSDIVKVMAYDSLLDFFITGVTVITLLVSAKGVYAVDSFCGIAISGVILISAFKLIRESTGNLMNIPTKEKTEVIEEILLYYGINPDNSELIFSVTDKEAVFLVSDTTEAEENIEEIKKQIFEKTGTEIYFSK